jgi:hypothetical protein
LIAREKRGGDCGDEEKTVETQKNLKKQSPFYFFWKVWGE